MTQESNLKLIDSSIGARAEERVNAELDAIPWDETLKSQAATIARIKRRREMSGKRITVGEGNRSHVAQTEIEVETEGLGPNEWWYQIVSMEPGKIIQGGLTTWDYLENLVVILNVLRMERKIEGFDFGVPFRTSPTQHKIELEGYVAISITAAPDKKEQFLAHQRKLHELLTSRRSISSPVDGTSV